MRRGIVGCCALLAVHLCGGEASAQAAPAVAQQAQAVVSPEVHADRRVTVRLRAPAAAEVVVTGEITEGGAPIPMARDGDGVWTATIGPLGPDIYTYAFRVDGVNTPDPQNPWIKTVAATGLASQVQVPGDAPQYYDARPVQHGLVSMLNYHSSALGVPRTAWVYTPPGYEASGETYPVLYLLHGGGDTEPGWVLTGRANFILDNLIADGRARPMVVVMPNAHARPTIGVGPAAQAAAGATFEQDLLRDLMPTVERTFRVSRDPDERAMMGLSMGGGITLRTGLNHPDKFRWIVGLSSALGAADPAETFAGFLADPAAANQQLRLLYLAIGEEDALPNFVAQNQRLSDALTRAGIRHTFRVTEGGHWWRLWRRDLYEVAPLLFR
jgi:enterochelin esterase-like enzyme